jgi:uncharacterized protein (TIGR02246 family)
MKLTTLSLAVWISLATLSQPSLAQHEGHGAQGDSAAVAAVVTKFNGALAAGDSAAALALLADDAVILESGGVETRAQYRSHHLQADINFYKGIKSQRGPLHVKVHGDVAWTTGVNTAEGERNGRPVNSTSAELMVLVRTPGGWRISAIHWSSRTRSPS